MVVLKETFRIAADMAFSFVADRVDKMDRVHRIRVDEGGWKLIGLIGGEGLVEG